MNLHKIAGLTGSLEFLNTCEHLEEHSQVNPHDAMTAVANRHLLLYGRQIRNDIPRNFVFLPSFPSLIVKLAKSMFIAEPISSVISRL